MQQTRDEFLNRFDGVLRKPEMTSREIAELLDRPHSWVMDKIFDFLQRRHLTMFPTPEKRFPRFESYFVTAQNVRWPMYVLPKRELLTFLSSDKINMSLRGAIVGRWLTLESELGEFDEVTEAVDDGFDVPPW